MKRNRQVSFRLTERELTLFKKLVKESGLNHTNFFLSCISQNGIQVSKPIEIKHLKPPTRLPKPTKEIKTLPRSMKADFLNEIHEVFKNKGIFVN